MVSCVEAFTDEESMGKDISPSRLRLVEMTLNWTSLKKFRALLTIRRMNCPGISVHLEEHWRGYEILDIQEFAH